MIWADAICINQDDNDEKSRQVRLMAQIYSKATYALVWLGEEADDSDLVFPLFEQIAAVEDFPAINECNDLSMFLMERNLPPVDDRAWASVWALLMRPWFSRVWIVQEFVVAQDVYIFCGQQVINWKNMFLAIDFIYSSTLPGALFPKGDMNQLLADIIAAMSTSPLRFLHMGYHDGSQHHYCSY